MAPAVENIDRSAIILAAEYCRAVEGFSAEVYADPISGGIPHTCGFGSTRNLQGQPWQMRQSCTMAEAEIMLQRDLFVVRVRLSMLPNWELMDMGLKAALLSLSFSDGYFNKDGNHDRLDALIQYRHFNNIPKQLLVYNKADGEPVLGIARRRLGEAYLCRHYRASDAKEKAWQCQSIEEIMNAET